MSDAAKEQAMKKFREIPGVGKVISRDLWDLGMRSFEDIAKSNPEKMYKDLCMLRQMYIDRCMLYVLRTAVYYASHVRHDPRLLQWWNWTDERRGQGT